MTASTLVEPAFYSAPEFSKTLGPEVADLAELAGFAPDPEQRLALDAIFAMRPDNKVAALEAAVVACRQNIKTGLFKQCALGWLFVTDQRLIVWSAHEFSTSQEAHRDLAELITNCDPLRKRVKAITNGNGDEGIELLTGQRVKFRARTKTGGRGLSGDKIVLDEAFALQATHMGSLFPLLSVRPDPQVLYGSSAGLTSSGVLRSIRDRGRAGGDPRLAYLEWTDDLPGSCSSPACDHALGSLGCRLDDEARWHRSNTQLGRRMTIEYVRAERRALPAAEFARERMGWWDDPVDLSSMAVSPEVWATLANPQPRPASATLVLDVAADQSTATLAAAWKCPGGVQVQLADHRAGTSWVVAKCVELGWPVLLVKNGTAAFLQADLERAGVRVTTVDRSFFVDACGSLNQQVTAGTVWHGNQPALNDAVKVARWSPTGEAGVRVLARKDPAVSPLIAFTLALHAVSSTTAEPTYYGLSEEEFVL